MYQRRSQTAHYSGRSGERKLKLISFYILFAEGEGVDGKEEKDDYDPWPNYRFTG